MKIYITENLDKAIENYKLVPILYGKLDMYSIPNNSATEIVAVDAVDSIPSEFLTDFISSIRQKMRIGSKLIVGGIELSAISRDVVNGKISTKDYNELIFSKKGVYRSRDIIDLLQQADLSVEQASIKGYQYEITAIRPQSTN
jgi:predicted DNA-binding protein (UPF0278 family)